MSILNQMRKNPAMTAGAFIFIIALIAVIGWIVNRRKKGSTGPGAASGLPELSVSGVKTVKSIKTSEYSIMRENALGDHLGDNIDFKITLNTKGGFEENGVVKIVAQRISSEGNIVASKNINNVTNYSDYTIDFRGIDLSGDAVAATGGKNTFNIIGYTSDNDVYTIVNPLATQDVTITADELDYALAESMVSTFAFSLGTNANATILGVDLSNISRSKYYLSILPNEPLSIIPVTNGFSFQYADKTTLLTVDNTTVFKLDKFGEKYRLYSGDQMVTREGGTGDLVLKKPNDMNAAEAGVALMDISALGGYVYKFVVKDVTTFDASGQVGDNILGPHISEIKVDGSTISAYQIAFGSSDTLVRRETPRDDGHAYDNDIDTAVSWRKESVDDTLMTITLPTKPNTISVAWTRQQYRPNFKIYENDALIITESGTRADTMKSDVSMDGIIGLETVYDIKNQRVYTASPGFNRSDGILSGPHDDTKDYCKTKCDSLTNCVGFGWSEEGNGCYMKKSVGLGGYEPTTAWTFYEKSQDGTGTTGSYHRWMGDSDTHAVNAIGPIDPSIDVVISPGEDISKCYNICDANDDCGGFNTDVSRTLCSFKPKTVYPKASLGTYSDGVTYDFFAKKSSYPWMANSGQDGTMDTAPTSTSNYATPSLEHCKTDCLNDTACKGITMERLVGNTLMCHRKGSVGNLTNNGKPAGVTWTWYEKM